MGYVAAVDCAANRHGADPLPSPDWPQVVVVKVAELESACRQLPGGDGTQMLSSRLRRSLRAAPWAVQSGQVVTVTPRSIRRPTRLSTVPPHPHACLSLASSHRRPRQPFSLSVRDSPAEIRSRYGALVSNVIVVWKWCRVRAAT